MLKKILVTAGVIILLSGCASKKKNEIESEALDLLNTEMEKQSIDKVYFGFDKSDLSELDIETLKKQSEWIQKHPNIQIEIEGHCDARGTREYNLALGERRAHSVKKYLVQTAGLNTEKIGTISYGKERPAQLGESAEADALNRRAVTVVVSK